ncbi:MAG: glycosyltransferase family 4 protein [Acidimicrobiia bacterium]
MRIVIIEPDGTGGMIHFAYMLARALTTLGAQVTLITAVDYELSDLPHEFEVRTELVFWRRVESSRSDPDHEDGSWLGRLRRHVIRRAWRAVRLTIEMWRVVALVGKTRPDVLLIRPFPLPGRRLILARLKASGTTLIEVTHEFEPREAVNPVVARIERALSGNGSSLIDLRLFLASSVRDRYALLYPRVPRSRMLVIPHGDGELFELLARGGADLAERFRIEADDRVVLFFGNLRPSKGIVDLLEGFARANRPPDAKLLVVGYPGRDVDVGSLFELTRKLQIVDSVRFDIGYLPNELVGPLFRLARFVVLPYRNATQSGPLHVAITFGKPVLATRTGGMVDVIEDGVTGLLVEPGDAGALSAGLERMLWDDELMARMEGAVSRYRARFRWSEVAARVLESTEAVRAERSP